MLVFLYKPSSLLLPEKLSNISIWSCLYISNILLVARHYLHNLTLSTFLAYAPVPHRGCFLRTLWCLSFVPLFMLFHFLRKLLYLYDCGIASVISLLNPMYEFSIVCFCLILSPPFLL